jgi:hypothetical protein
MRLSDHLARIREKRCAYRVLVGNSEGKRPLRRPRHRWEDNIKIDLGETGRGYELGLSGSGWEPVAG